MGNNASLKAFYLNSFNGIQCSDVSMLVNRYLRVPMSINDKMSKRTKNYYLSRACERFHMFNEVRALKPIDNEHVGNMLGIEIECYSKLSRVEIYAAIKLLNLKISNIKLGTDASIHTNSDDMRGYEFRVLTNINDFSNLKQLCILLDAIGAKVNVTCGLHVHLDLRQFKAMPWGMVRRFKSALPLLNSMLPMGRRTDFYSASDVSHIRIENSYSERQKGAPKYRYESNSRYAKINTLAYEKFKTLEIRMHSGTTNFDKITQWCRVLHSIAKSKALKLPNTSNAQFYAAKLGWDYSLLNYVTERQQKFEKQSFEDAALTYRYKNAGYNRELIESNIDINVDYERVA